MNIFDFLKPKWDSKFAAPDTPAYKAGKALYEDVKDYFPDARRWKDLTQQEQEDFVNIWWRIFNKGALQGARDEREYLGVTGEE